MADPNCTGLGIDPDDGIHVGTAGLGGGPRHYKYTGGGYVQGLHSPVPFTGIRAIAFGSRLEKPQADLSGDWVVNFLDFSVLAGEWLDHAPPELVSDLSGDGKVDLDDVVLMTGDWLTDGL